jgi:hypothetical protein
MDPMLLSEGPPPPPHLLVFGNNVTNALQPQLQPPSFSRSASPPAFSTPSHALSPIPVSDENVPPPSQPPPSQKRRPKPTLSGGWK